MNEEQFLPGLEPDQKSNLLDFGSDGINQAISKKEVSKAEPEDIFRGESESELRELVLNCPACNQLGYHVRCAKHKHIRF